MIAEGSARCRRGIPISISAVTRSIATGNGVAMVAKGPDGEAAERAIAEVTELISGFGKVPIAGEPPEK